jgi:decaprenylphospho-beta-D-erythro-pentofuranosid-2-ulose 2-reductase
MNPFALVIGASSDIGKYISLELAKKKFNLYLTGRNLNILEDLKKSILELYNIEIEIFLLNMLDFASHEKFYSSIQIKPKLVISAVGYYEDQNKAREDFNEAYKTVSVNYLGLMNLINIISLDFEKRGFGNISVISSVAGIRGRQLNYIYGSAKAGIRIYLQGLRNKLHSKNITITTILLGPVYTKMSSGHKLMPVLTLKPEIAAKKILEASLDGKNETYISWIWRFIMLIIQLIPEFIFKRLPPF